MSSRSFDYNDEDHDRFVLGARNGPGPDGLVFFIIIAAALLIWWLK